MKHNMNIPHHKVPECMTTHSEVDAKVVHNGDVISELLRGREMCKPAIPFTFREADPPTCWSRCSHRSRIDSGDKGEATKVWGGGAQDTRQKFRPAHQFK
jgi:hypothetical protein